MPLKLKRFEEGKWYDFQKYEGVRFKIRALSRKDIVQCWAYAKQGGDGKAMEEADRGLLAWEGFKKALLAWEGVELPKDSKPTRDQILEALFEDSDIVNFVAEKCYDSSEAEQGKLEAELGNSESSQSG